MNIKQLRLSATAIEAIDAVMEIERAGFNELVSVAKLDPAHDFVGAGLRGIKLATSDLRGFDLTDADLRGTGISRATLDATTTLIGAKLDTDDAEALKARGFALVAAPSPGTPPEDFDLDEVKQMILKGRAPPPAWRPWVTELNFSRSELANLAPLAALANLQTLFLNNTQVADIAPLAALANLQTLFLNNTQVADIAPLAKLPNLKDVYVERGRVGVLAQTLGRRGVVKLAPWIRMPKATTTDAPRGRAALSRRSRSR